jgi:POT family proton-dependent oligopeptide transporter
MASKYRTAPELSTRMPPGVPYIIGNEAAERFSFYGMKAILVVFMTGSLLARDGSRDAMTDEQARFWMHLFVTAAYSFPFLGAILSDAVLGKYRTIIWLSLVYCLGHLALAIDHTRLGLAAGLTLIAMGAGGIKPCVSAHVGDQFGAKNQYRITTVFAWFYFSINLGAMISTWITPYLLDDSRFGPHWAFGVPGVFMLLATLVFWLGRNRFVHVPAGGAAAVREAFSGDGLLALRNLLPVFVLIAVFWSVFDQTASAWVLQAKRMNLHFAWVDWLPAQVQVFNPFLILVMIPLFAYVVYPAIGRVFPLTPLRKISIGLFVALVAWMIPGLIDTQITGGQVVVSTSEGDVNHMPANNLLDGQDATGWVSAAVEESKGESPPPQDIVIRLRERRAWNIDSVRMSAEVDLDEFLDEKEYPQDEFAELAETCRAREVEVLAGDSRKEPWTSLGRIELPPDGSPQTLEFDPVEYEYVIVRIHSNWDGPLVCLGEVEVLSPNPLPADAHRRAEGVWPNVAATGYKPSIAWQVLAYVLLTAAEVMISITGLEFSYTQAPRKMKSFIMSLWLLTVAAGNLFTALVNLFIQKADGSSRLDGPAYYWFFGAVLAVAAVLFIFVARIYRGRTYIQDGT